jgi:dienelactone hydrolase
MKHNLTLITALLLAPLVFAADAGDPFAKVLDGKAPTITKEFIAPPAGVTVRRVLFRIRDKNEAYALIAIPNTPGKHPGILVLHGSGGNAEEEKAMAWAQRGYVAVAPDMPGLYSPLTRGDLPMSKGYADGRYSMQPDTTKSVIFDGMLAAMKALDLLRSLPETDTNNVGVVGVSWGGTMTTMVCGLAGDKVKAGFAIWGGGFFDLGGWRGGKPAPAAKYGVLAANMTAEERARWLRDLDPGRRAPKMKAAFFLAGATNDFFGWPEAVQATLDAIPGEKNHFYAPNSNHKAMIPGGTVFDSVKSDPKHPQLTGARANWLAMEVPYFEYHLKGIGKPLPKVKLAKSDDAHLARFTIDAPHPILKAELYWAAPFAAETLKDPALLAKAVVERKWTAIPATKNGDSYEAAIPAEAAQWFILTSDDRPMSVSSDMITVSAK